MLGTAHNTSRLWMRMLAERSWKVGLLRSRRFSSNSCDFASFSGLCATGDANLAVKILLRTPACWMSHVLHDGYLDKEGIGQSNIAVMSMFLDIRDIRFRART